MAYFAPPQPQWQPAYYSNTQWSDLAFLPSPSPDSDHRSDSPSLTFSPALSVKEEPDDADPSGCFIMELSTQPTAILSQSLAPPTEVPLRATQASTHMRRMMTVFRLNPFAIHSGAGRGTVPVQYETAHPLDAEPVTFEFQLDLDPGILDPDAPTDGIDNSLNTQDLRPFSPDFVLHEKTKDHSIDEHALGSDSWYDYSDTASATSPPMSQSWNIGYPDTQDHFSSINYVNQSPSRRPPRQHNSVSHHSSYIQKADGVSGYSNPSSNSSPSSSVHYQTSNHHQQHRIISPQPHPPGLEPHHHHNHNQPQWDHHTSQRGIGYHTNSAAASRSPSLSEPNGYTDASINLLSCRRWSLDSQALPAPPQFLV